MIYKKIVLFLVVSISFFQIYGDISGDIQKKHQKVISQYMKLGGQMKLYNYGELQNLFKTANQVDAFYLKALRNDIATLKKTIRKEKKYKETYLCKKDLLTKLNKIYKFFKKYYLELEVLNFLDQVHQEWGDIIEAVDKGKNILPLLKTKGICNPGVAGLKVFVKRMSNLLYKVEDYENRVHADFIDLKLSNYVLRIELIRIRNAAIFHPLYRGMPIVTSYPR
jgi:hypothetical protein